jgi:hypothetical protein
MNMRMEDLAFDKDHGEPDWTFRKIRRLLEHPDQFPALGDRIYAELTPERRERVWLLMGDLLETSREAEQQGVLDEVPLQVPPGLDPALSDAIAHFAAAASAVEAELETAFSGISDAEKQYAACSYLGGILNAEGRPEIRALIQSSGVTAPVMGRVMRECRALDPGPAARAFLQIMERCDTASLLRAADRLSRTMDTLSAEVEGVARWPASLIDIPSPAGPILIGTTANETYGEEALLILDPGGDDRYEREAGVAHALLGRPVACILDLAGSDIYAGTNLWAAGSACFGLSEVRDESGADVYRAHWAGQAAACFGVAWLTDLEGDDVYRAGVFAQGAAAVGCAVLDDRKGNDVYEVGLYGQGLAGVAGVGALHDLAGHDLYRAGGRERDAGRHDDRYLSLAQGMSIGSRPFAGGGYGILLDRAGNDAYVADIFGQGVSYWYSAGFLLDGAGNDTFDVYHYGQGSGIHLSLGLLADYSGQDRYHGYILAQGSAHDYGVGLLVDQAGEDTYTADHHAQGRALNNGLAVLLECGGDDAYFGRQPEQCQGVGNDGGRREYGSMALLMDLAGQDQYSCGARDGARMLRPDFGVVYDVEKTANHPSPKGFGGQDGRR